MQFLLDSNLLSEVARRPSSSAGYRFEEALDECATSIIVASEIRFGIAKRPSARGSIRAQALLDRLPIIPFEAPADQFYADLRAELEAAGTPIGGNDMLIAAHALALGCTLITANERGFQRVRGLRVENWLP